MGYVNFHNIIQLLLILCLYPDFIRGMSSISLCINGKHYDTNQEACPGGIVFKKQFRVNSHKSCLCINGIFHVRDSEGSRIISGNSHCINDHHIQQTLNTIHHLIPFAHPMDPHGYSTLSLWNHAHLEDNYFRRIRLPAQLSRNEIPKYMFLPNRGYNSLEPEVQELCLESDSHDNIIDFSDEFDFPELLRNFTCGPTFRGSRTQVLRKLKHLGARTDSCEPCSKKHHHLHKRDTVTSGESPFGAKEEADGTNTIEGLSGNKDKSWEKFLIEDYQLVEYKLRLSAVQIYPLQPTTHKLKLLQLSKEIVKRGIGRKIIPNTIFDEAFEFFNYLFYGEGKDTLTPDKFSDIQYALQQCLNGAHELKFHFTDDGTCPQKIKYYEYKPLNAFGNGSIEMVDTGTLVGNDRIYSSKQNDPIVEIMWKVVDFTHSYCHEDFGFHLNMHHYYEQEMEKLFLIHPIQERWFRAINPETYQVLLPYSNLVNHIENMDRIVGSVHLGRHYNYWLRKPKMNHQRRKRREIEIESQIEPFAEHEIWDGLAYCLKTTDSDGNGMIPNLRELNTYLATV